MEEKLNFDKIWKMFQETDKKFQETDRKFQETDKKIKETNKSINGIGKSNGEIAEDFFFNGLKSTMKIGEIEISFIDRNLERFSKKLQLKYGFYIITQSGENLKYLNPVGRMTNGVNEKKLILY